MEEMVKQLNLTPDQTTQFKAIMLDQRTKMEALRSDTSDSKRDRRKQMMSIHEEEVAKIHAILTPEQKTKYDAMQAQMRDQMRDQMRERRRDGGDPPPPPPPPSQL
jgi:Spy/CpxP family protein refolding chaperone